MILVDTAVWADHIGKPDERLFDLLAAQRVVMHPFVLGEISLGSLRDRRVISTLADLPHAKMAFDWEVLTFIDGHSLHGTGIGYVDAHLLISVRLSDGYRLWTRDKRLHAAAERVGVAWSAP